MTKFYFLDKKQHDNAFNLLQNEVTGDKQGFSLPFLSFEPSNQLITFIAGSCRPQTIHQIVALCKTFHLIYGFGPFRGVHYSKTADYYSKPNLRVEKKFFKIFQTDF